ncbi:CPBP family intramembrane metalloprotease [Streptomyces sp. JH14]|uniref:CPBP family intramembrane glutamic endopeptidase n=1 Tax=Streptomyces sp. JH14 TaxID=2793630 RepID=UPI0023F9ECF6|nr:CPBP family intramembrane glutamic endopeptidase [Streptomyces sp. JH14]MDF6046420.1 CPBP family intramembrane metalloprotease [Streptomyces sp. JH14]
MMHTTSTTHDETGHDQLPDGSGPSGGRVRRICRSPFGSMLIGIVGVGVVSAATATGPGPLPVLGAATAVAVYWAVTRFVARGPVPEITRRGAVREALLGGGIGLGFILVSALVITAFGGYSFSWAGNGFFSVVASAVAVQAGAAVMEELMFRGLVLQALERLFGSRAAVAITALLFGAAHLANPGATVWSGLAIALEAGVLLGAAFLWRRSIWFVVGMHFAWNATEQLLGIPVSGNTAKGLLSVDVSGSAMLTGGTFSLEASIVTVLIGVALAVPMFVIAHRRGGLLPRQRAAR